MVGEGLVDKIIFLKIRRVAQLVEQRPPKP